MTAVQALKGRPPLAGLLALPRVRQRRRLRRTADAWILASSGREANLYRWRVAELTSPRERRLLSRSLRAVVAELSSGRLPGAAPVNRVALRPHVDLLGKLADRLAALDRPVGAAGILEVRRLLTDPGSPLYAHPAAGDLRETLQDALDRLEAC